MKNGSLVLAAAVALAGILNAEELRPPSVPLVSVDPYFSIWSPADKLTDANTTHWTGKPHRLTSLVRIDGKAYRVMGMEPADVPALEQKKLTVLPTRSIYEFEGGGIALTLTFMTPALPDDLDILSRPVTYLTYDFRSTDGGTHSVQAYFDARAEIAVNTGDQAVKWEELDVPGLAHYGLKVGSESQQVLAKSGDDLRIDWGYFYITSPQAHRVVPMHTVFSPGVFAQTFAARGDKFINNSALFGGRIGEVITLSLFLSEGKAGPQPFSCWVMLAYDDLYSIQYMKSNLRPYWRRNGWEATDLLKAAAKDYESLCKRCAAFDEELMADLTKAGGEKYAKLCALAFRQCFAAGKFVADANGKPLSFCKENHSNGCISTSDVFYPMSPQFLLFGPTLTKSFLVPFMNYVASPRWKFPFAAHDLGTYPHANGQRYGGGERTEDNQMPVEETGNLLLIITALAQMEGNADFAGLYWPQLEKWAAYLKEKGFDPENQLCTDDFAGHLAHNVNLSAKAICALGAFGRLCEMRGDKAKAGEYDKIAKEFAARWVKEADDGDHFRLAFDKPGTWSQKYNMMWDRILGLNLFPPEVARKEMDYYRKIQNKYGVPLDNRKEYTKLDWITWTATLTQNRDDFEALINPIITFINETPDRSPLTDWYQTKTAKKVGFTARPVIGGVFAQMLYDKAVWKKYASRDKTNAKDFAPMPQPPKTVTLVPTSEEKPATWRFTTEKPAANWSATDFDDSSWKQGPGGFGEPTTPGAVVRTPWKSSDIWVRRVVELRDNLPAKIVLRMHHDEDATVYLNGVLASQTTGYTSEYEVAEILPAARSALHSGKNVIAIHCLQTKGGQYIDAGLDAIVP